jgi:hypothetical protein
MLVPTAETIKAHKLQAKADRPEVKEIDIEAKLNNIDLALAKNNLLPSLDAEAAPARQPEKFVLGLGYRFGLELRIPILQRRSRGEVLEAQGKADRFVLTQRFREQQVVIDVDNALSAIERAKERIAAAVESLRLAKTLEDGERFRFSLGATSVLFVKIQKGRSFAPRLTIRRHWLCINGRSEPGANRCPRASRLSTGRGTDRRRVGFSPCTLLALRNGAGGGFEAA